MIQDATRLAGKVVIITGGAGGIGAATARLMTSRGARVAVADIAFAAAQALAAELPGALAIHLNLEDEASIEAMVAQAVAHYGRLDVLHNNAALLGPDIAVADGDVEHMATALWDRSWASQKTSPKPPPSSPQTPRAISQAKCWSAMAAAQATFRASPGFVPSSLESTHEPV